MNFSKEPEEFDPPYPLIAEDTDEALADLHARARTDYETWKHNVMEWLTTEGKDPDLLKGFAPETLRTTNYKIDQIMRWLWNERGYTTEFTPEDADQLMKELGRYTEYSPANLNTFVKTIKRIFSYYNHQKGKSHEWECNFNISEPKVTNRDYFYKREFRALYEASLEHGTVRHYHSCSPDERDELKAHLAQRFEKPKSHVSPEDFKRANSFKIPSLVAVSLDCGLRPVEVGRAKVSWVNFEEATLDIPIEDASKNKDNWKCGLSDNSIRALEKWLDERETYTKYDDREEIWLTKKATPYSSNTLNYLLDQLIEESGIKPAGRELTWYSIRHGVATVWVEDEDPHDARDQLRHHEVETTLSYAHSDPEERTKQANNKY